MIDSVILIFSIVILFCYLIQSIAAFIQASGNHLLLKVFHPEYFLETWGVVAMIFFIPFLVSNASGVIDLINAEEHTLAPTIMVSMLLIFITLEFSQLGSLNDKNKEWSRLLLIAITLDIFSIVIISTVKYNKLNSEAFVYALGLFAFLSSFMIILFAYVGGKTDEE